MSENTPRPYLWPAIIVLLLLSSVTASFGALWMAHSDGGVDVIPDYYQKAVDWDSLSAIQRKSDTLAWSSRIEIGVQDGLLEVYDRLGNPVSGLSGTLSIKKPGVKEPARILPLHSIPDSAGSYRFPVPDLGDGMWVVSISANLDTLHFVQTIRQEISVGH